MIFNGHTEQYINSLDEEVFTEIQVMYSDGLLGNRGIYDALTPITTAIFNYIKSPESPTIKANDIFPWINEYGIDPSLDVSAEEQASNGLLTYVTQAKNFKMDRFKNANLAG